MRASVRLAGLSGCLCAEPFARDPPPSQPFPCTSPISSLQTPPTLPSTLLLFLLKSPAVHPTLSMKTRSTSQTSAVRKTYVEPLSDSAPSTPSSLSASETLVHLKDGPFFPPPTALSTGALTSLVPLPGPSVGPNTLYVSPEPITTPAAAGPSSSSTSRKKRRVPTSEMSPEKLQAQRAKNRVKQARYRGPSLSFIFVVGPVCRLIICPHPLLERQLESATPSSSCARRRASWRISSTVSRRG